MINGGRRPGSGRRHRDTIRVACSIPRPVYEELISQEKLTGIYRTRVAARILCDGLIGGMVDRELKKENPPS